ncbi:MAG: VCBS repeat-containing protein, partial [Planctomycetaceae bacterium]|nr:VCBS repeat-containing protein [Planctomycetaceae bacterium]
TPFPGFTGGVSVATGDVNGDGVLDVIAAAGAGGGPHVKVFSGTDGSEIRSFFPFPMGFTGGVFVAVADLNNDGLADIIAGAGPGGGPNVVVRSGADTSVELFNFFAFGAGFTGGVRVATGDITNDGLPDIIAAAGPGGGPHVRIFDGSTPQTGGVVGTDSGNFFAYDMGFTGGVFVATGQVVGNDDRVDIITGPGSGGGPNVRVFDGSTLMQSTAPIGNFLAYGAGFTGGVRVSATDITGDGIDDIVTTPGQGGGPNLRIFDATSSTPSNNPTRDVNVGDGGFTGGLFVAGSPDIFSDGTTAPLMLAGNFDPSTSFAPLQLADVQPVFDAALARLQSAGASAEQLAALSTVTIEVADLSGRQLGEALPGRIVLDVDAAGVGWFIDLTPSTDEEFDPEGLNAIAPGAIGRVDLLTVILHELGHELGESDLDADVYSGHLMAESLPPGQRRLPRKEDFDQLFSQT